MDSFGNYPREKFDPFSVMLFKGLQVVCFLFFIALLAMNPMGKDHVTALLDAYLAMHADGIGARTAAEAAARLAGFSHLKAPTTK